MSRLHRPSSPAIGLLLSTWKCSAIFSTVKAFNPAADAGVSEICTNIMCVLTVYLERAGFVAREDAIEEHVPAGHGQALASSALPDDLSSFLLGI